ncbi:hypothetical protein HZA97_05680 [Candidatus Woesearchaeota archaeon]|nr:hypothetical protein [Candidatus Woesearchaeota archaeon]
MKGGYLALVTALVLSSCTSTPKQDNCRLSNQKYQQLVQIIKKQKRIKNNEETTPTALENKVELPVNNQSTTPVNSENQKQEQTEEVYENDTYLELPTNYSRAQTEQAQEIKNASNLFEFLRLNYGADVMNSLSITKKYEEVMDGLETIPNYQQIIPILLQGLDLQINDSYQGQARNKMPGLEEKLTAISLMTSLHNNSKLAELIKKLHENKVNFDVSYYYANIIPDLFLRIEDWENGTWDKPLVEFSAQKFLENILTRQDILDFIDHPESLDTELEQWLSRNTHYIQSFGAFSDGQESWENYKNLDLVQKLQLYNLIFDLNWGSLREEATKLIDIDFMLDYTEVGGNLVVLEDGLHLIQTESAHQRKYSEQNPVPMRIAGFTEELTEEQRMQIYGKSTWLTTNDISQLSQEQINKILKTAAEEQNKINNCSYIPENLYSKNKNSEIGMFHLHAQEINTSYGAGPSGWFPNSAVGKDGSLQVGGDLGVAIQQLDVNGRHSMNLLITSIDENTFDVNLYYAAGNNGRPVNVSVGAYKRTKPAK